MRKAFLGMAAVAALFVLAGTQAFGADEAKEIKGSAGCAKCCFNTGTACAAAVKVGDNVYTLKASDKADAATKDAIAKCAAAKTPKDAVDVTIKGVMDATAKTVVADSVVAAAAAPPAKK